MKSLEVMLADIDRKLAVLQNELTFLTDRMSKLERYVQELFKDDVLG
tara:strand:+ start:515 stop:655 length:141 start_codon:yes stop_codon:yes gene_type:complete